MSAPWDNTLDEQMGCQCSMRLTPSRQLATLVKAREEKTKIVLSLKCRLWRTGCGHSVAFSAFLTAGTSSRSKTQRSFPVNYTVSQKNWATFLL